jgi:UDP-N-acetylmuramate dehydrogenase
MDKNSNYRTLQDKFPGIFIKNELLSNHTSFKIGGTADLFCPLNNTGTLQAVLKEAKNLSLPVVLVGGGTNLLVDDRGFRGVAVKFSGAGNPEIDFPVLKTGAGIQLQNLLGFAAENSLSGFEFLAGVPGTVGGAIYMNAGAYGSSISDIFLSATILDDDFTFVEAGLEYFQFSYRNSILQKTKNIVVSASFIIQKGNKVDIISEYNRIKSIRAEKHPAPDMPCAGSYFKNLPPEKPGEHRRAAGYFLERAGAKSMRSGGAAVSQKHANMIINENNASAADVLQLAEMMKKAVFEKYGIMLEAEVRFLDAEKGIL